MQPTRIPATDAPCIVQMQKMMRGKVPACLRLSLSFTLFLSLSLPLSRSHTHTMRMHTYTARSSCGTPAGPFSAAVGPEPRAAPTGPWRRRPAPADQSSPHAQGCVLVRGRVLKLKLLIEARTRCVLAQGFERTRCWARHVGIQSRGGERWSAASVCAPGPARAHQAHPSARL